MKSSEISFPLPLDGENMALKQASSAACVRACACVALLSGVYPPARALGRPS